MSFNYRFEPPVDDTYFEGTRMPQIINIQRKLKRGIVRTSTGKKFHVTLATWLSDCIMLHDYVEIKKSAVTGEWIVTNYYINNEVYGAIHNSYQEDTADLMCNEDGVPYE